MHTDYVPIQSMDLDGERQITFDLFLSLPLNNRVILYRKKGGNLEEGRLSQLMEGNLQNFWIRKEDYNEFVKYVAMRMKSMIEHPNEMGNRQRMVSAAKSMLGSTIESSDPLMVNAMMSNLNEITCVLVESVLENISPSRKKSFRRLMEMAEKGTDFHKHPVNVTSLAVMVAFGIGYSTEKILSEVAVGALLHDIGISRLPAKISSSAHEPLSLEPEERQLLYKHGEFGIHILAEKNIVISEIVRSIICQHHEKFSGTGYPLALRGYVINEFAQIVHVADELDHLFRHRPSNAETLCKHVEQLFDRMILEKEIEPSLADRIRALFV